MIFVFGWVCFEVGLVLGYMISNRVGLDDY